MMDYERIKKYTQEIREAQLTGDKEYCKKLMLESYGYCFDYYVLACETLRRTNDSKLVNMIVGMRNALDNFGKLHTEYVEEINDMN